MEVLALIAEGFRDRDIAEQLEIGLTTAETYVKILRVKLDARSRTQAVTIGFRRGLLT